MTPFLNNAYFFCRYMIQVTFISNSLQLLAFPTVIVKKFKSFIASNDLDKLYPFIIKKNFDFGYNYSFGCIVFLMILIFSTTIPIIVPFGCLFFYIKYYVDKYNLLFFYPVEFDGVGTLADIVIKLMIFAVFLFQIVLSGLFYVLNDRIDSYITYISIGYMLISVILYFVAGYLFVEETKKNINKIGNNLLKFDIKNEKYLTNIDEYRDKDNKIENKSQSIKSDTTNAFTNSNALNTHIPINENVKNIELNNLKTKNSDISNDSKIDKNKVSIINNSKISSFNKLQVHKASQNEIIESDDESDNSDEDYENFERLKEMEKIKKVQFAHTKKPLKLIKNIDIKYNDYLENNFSLKKKLLDDLCYFPNKENESISNPNLNSNNLLNRQNSEKIDINVGFNPTNLFENEKLNKEMSSYFLDFYTHPTSKNLKSKTFKDFDYNNEKLTETNFVEHSNLEKKKEKEKIQDIQKMNEEFAIYKLEKGKLVKADVTGLYEDDLFEENS